jgi:Spx/MgsR family transcriptional regulator
MTGVTSTGGETPILYLWRSCSTCQAARKWLAGHGIATRERELFKEPLSAAEITALLGARPLSEVVSTRSPAYRARGLHLVPASDAELLRQLTEEPRLLRRPLLRVGDDLLVGFDPERWQAALLGLRPPARGRRGSRAS